MALWKDDLALRIEVRPLSRDEVAQLLGRRHRRPPARTVHAHLRSAYAKLGVAGRGELAAILGGPPPPGNRTLCD